LEETAAVEDCGEFSVVQEEPDCVVSHLSETAWRLPLRLFFRLVEESVCMSTVLPMWE
jgi:hypothetical protein